MMMTSATVILTLMVSATSSTDHVSLSGDNVCQTQVLETKQINVTYLEAVRIKKHSLCITPPFVCAEWVNTMETKWRKENVTRTVNMDTCCPGYEPRDNGTCGAVCSAGCVHGQCVAPEQCQCLAGFSGPRCDVVGCPRGTWGVNCEATCTCQHGGWCDAVSGECHCTPGYLGQHCSDQCSSGSWGQDCEEKCDCDTGHTCHHVTGDCSPCKPGHYGDQCLKQCSCDNDGTELCSHVDGRCFCKGNWFGVNCDQHCPFGWSDGTCHVSPLANGTCQCATDLYTCDPELGCVCPTGNCGLEMLPGEVRLSPYNDSGDPATDQRTATISLSVLLIAGVAIVLVVIYYRRRLSVVRKDLQNRSVYYCDRELPDNSRVYDLIVRDTNPVNNDGDGNMLNNIRLNLDSQRFDNHQRAAVAEKNVNVDRAQDDSIVATGACANFDVNMFSKDEKSNINQRYESKVVKSDLEVMIRNNLTGDKPDNTEDDNDSVHRMKMGLSKK